MSDPVLVVGATGNVGRAVTASLLAAGIPVRAADRDPARVPAVLGGRVQTTRLDLYDPATFAPALDGAAGLFLLRPPSVARVGTTLNALIDAASRSGGIRHVVFSSVAGADTNRIVPHHRIERHLRVSGLPWTILRPGFFAQNLGDAYHTDIVADDRIFVPAGSGRIAFLDVRDLGDVAAEVFADPQEHRSRGYLLTGPQAITFDEVAQTLSAALGRPIRYQPATVPGYVRHLLGRGAPLPQVLVQTILHTGLRRGDAEQVDPTVQRLLGRTARTIADYVRDEAPRWARA